MNETNRTLKTTEYLIRERFPQHFGDRHRIDRIVSSSFGRKEREVNYITVYVAPDGPPLDRQATEEFDLLLKKELTQQDIRDWPAIAFITADRDTPRPSANSSRHRPWTQQLLSTAPTMPSTTLPQAAHRARQSIAPSAPPTTRCFTRSTPVTPWFSMAYP